MPERRESGENHRADGAHENFQTKQPIAAQAPKDAVAHYRLGHVLVHERPDHGTDGRVVKVDQKPAALRSLVPGLADDDRPALQD